MPLTEVVTLLKKNIGLDVATVGVEMIKRAVAERIRVTKLQDIDDYVALLRDSGVEMRSLIEAVVIPETFFFRHPEGIGAFQQVVRQTLFFSSEKIRVLSIPCSTGEEPYSLAISLLELGLSGERFGIDASDVSEHALQTARAGVFGNHSFRGTDGNLRARYFEETNDGARLAQRVRDCVRFTQDNVVAENFRFGSGPYHFIFCRNLLIYFDEKTQGDTLGRLEKFLTPGGLLFVGPAEAGLLINHGFVSARMPMAFGFYRREGAPAALPRPVRSKVSPHPRETSTGRPQISGVPGRVSPEPATSPLEQAGQLADQGRLCEASELCETLLRTAGPSAALFYLLALIRDGGGNLEAASRLYRKALYLDPDHYQAAIHLALLNERSGDHAGAQLLKDRARRAQERAS